MQDLSQFFVSSSSYCNTDECLRGVTLSQAYARASRYEPYHSFERKTPGLSHGDTSESFWWRDGEGSSLACFVHLSYDIHSKTCLGFVLSTPESTHLPLD